MKKAYSVLIKNAQIVTLNSTHEVIQGDVLVADDRIAAIGHLNQKADVVIDAGQQTLIPGFIQTHIHLCQTLFRNTADDLPLLEWLEKHILPMEAAHDPDSLRISARLGIAELIKSGTTTILDMGTVNHQEVVFEELEHSGLRAFSGQCMMDTGDAPARLVQPTAQVIDESLRLAEKWHGRDHDRIRYAFAPRFGLSCSQALLTQTLSLALEKGYLFHSHASENKEEVAQIRKQTGLGNIEYLDSLGLLTPQTLLAHCIWLSEQEIKLLADTGTRVLHCPSANLKLGSGIAPVPELLARGILVSLAADGACCNNNLDIFMEMRLAAFIQKVRLGPQALSAQTVFDMATINGARSLAVDDQVGAIQVGKKADLVLLQSQALHNTPAGNIYGQIVYSCRSGDVRMVMVNGRILLRDGILLHLDEHEIMAETKKQRQRIMEKI